MKNTKKLAFRGGSYSLIISCIVLAILIFINIFASSLPTTITNFDISASKLYSITSNTKVVVNNLEDDVTIYWIVQSGKEDKVIGNLLDKYDSLSDHIDIVKKNPDVFPAFAEQYTKEQVENNSLVVESGERFRYIPYSDIYLQQADMYSYSYSTSFDGEGAITSAIDYVISEELPQVYVLEGHGESELPDTFADQIKKENYEVNKLSLLKVDKIPEDASFLMIFEPQSDISDKEKTMLEKYVKNGGKLLVMAGPVEDAELTVLYSILEDYGITSNEGIVVEADRNHYAFQSPFVLLPDVNSNEITDSLISESYYPIMPLSLGLTVDSSNENVNILLETSSDSFSKIKGFAIDTYDKEEGDIDGSFALGVEIKTDNDGRIIWYSSSEFLQDMYNAYSSGANVNLAMNSISALAGQRDSIAIREKSLNYNYLTISSSQSAMLKLVMIVLIPLIYLGMGIYELIDSRRKQNAEA